MTYLGDAWQFRVRHRARPWASQYETSTQSKAVRIKHPECAACGALEKLHGHHKRYGRGRSARLVTLCQICHMAVHAEAKAMREPLDMVTNRYIRTHQRIIAALLRRPAVDDLAVRQQTLRQLLKQRESGTGTVAP